MFWYSFYAMNFILNVLKRGLKAFLRHIILAHSLLPT